MGSVSIHHNGALLDLAVVVNIPVVHADGLDVSGTDLDIDPAVVDVHIAQVDDFIALRHIGQLGGVDLGGVGRDSNLALAGLDIVLNVPIVDADIPLNKNGNLTVLDG